MLRFTNIEPPSEEGVRAVCAARLQENPQELAASMTRPPKVLGAFANVYRRSPCYADFGVRPFGAPEPKNKNDGLIMKVLKHEFFQTRELQGKVLDDEAIACITLELAGVPRTPRVVCYTHDAALPGRDVNNTHAIFMEDAGTSTLSQCVMTGDPALARGRIRVDEACAEGLAFQCIVTIVGMHKAGVTHNDVKPHNIVVKDKGHEFAEIMGTRFECTFVDLGCATYNDAEGMTGMPPTNTAAYMCPLALCAHINALNGSGDGKQNGFQSDMYAFGVTMVELFGLSINHLHGIQGKAGKTDLWDLLKHVTSMKSSERWNNEQVAGSAFVTRFMEKHPRAAGGVVGDASQASSGAGPMAERGAAAAASPPPFISLLAPAPAVIQGTIGVTAAAGATSASAAETSAAAAGQQASLRGELGLPWKVGAPRSAGYAGPPHDQVVWRCCGSSEHAGAGVSSNGGVSNMGVASGGARAAGNVPVPGISGQSAPDEFQSLWGSGASMGGARASADQAERTCDQVEGANRNSAGGRRVAAGGGAAVMSAAAAAAALPVPVPVPVPVPFPFPLGPASVDETSAGGASGATGGGGSGATEGDASRASGGGASGASGGKGEGGQLRGTKRTRDQVAPDLGQSERLVRPRRSPRLAAKQEVNDAQQSGRKRLAPATVTEVAAEASSRRPKRARNGASGKAAQQAEAGGATSSGGGKGRGQSRRTGPVNTQGGGHNRRVAGCAGTQGGEDGGQAPPMPGVPGDGGEGGQGSRDARGTLARARTAAPSGSSPVSRRKGKRKAKASGR